MTDDTLSRIAGWCEAANDLEMDGTTVTVAGDPPLRIEVEAGEDAIVLTHRHAAGAVPEDFASRAGALLGGRGSMLSGEVVAGEDGTRVELRYPIYLDGLNRQTFLLAVRDITATADSLGEMAAPASAPAAAPEPAAAPLAPAAEPEREPAAERAASAETVIVDAPWAPTHTVPGGGMAAWAEPDPALAPVAKLAARVELQVNEERGAWARVTGSNGWTGWVDGRKLRPLDEAGAAPVRPAGYPAAAAAGGGGLGGLALRPLLLVGGLAMILGSSPLLKWLPTSNYDIDAWEVGTGWLWQGSLANPRLGLLMTLLGVAAIALAFLRRAPMAATVPIGAAGVLITVLFAFHVIRLPWLANGQWKVLWDGGIGAGWWIALLGSIVVALPLTLTVGRD